MKNKLVNRSFCLLLAFALLFGEGVPSLRRADRSAASAAEQTQTVLTAQDETPALTQETALPSEQSEGVVRPEEIDEGLTLNSLDDIRGRRVTVRQPVMEILEDDIVRKPAEVMDNVYEMLDLKTGNKMHELAKIDFASDRTLQAGNKDHPMYPMKGLDRSPKDADGKVTEQKYFSEFKKYMLLRQAYYFNTHVSEIIQNNELKKHPAADYIYGKIPDEAKAVKMRIVTDPIYRSPITTGLYLVPGEVATVKIKGLRTGETVSLYTHHQDTMGYLGYDENGKGFGKMEDYLRYWDDKIVAEAERAQKTGTQPEFEKLGYGLHGQWQWQNQKVPCMGTTFNIVGTGQDTEVKIGSMYGGPLYIKPTSDAVEVEITGAVLTPHFVLGVTTVEEFEKELRSAPGLVATLDVENGQLIGPADAMRNCDDIEKLAYFWHSVFAIDISLNGRDYNYNMTMCYDMHVPAGEAVALNSNFCAQPEYWFPVCMNYETLTTKGNWGTFHELGHVQAKTHGVNWGFCDGDGEVWNNTLILLIYSMLCNMDSRVVGVEHGEYVHPYTAVERSQKITQEYTDKETKKVVKIKDYGEINEGNGAHFDQLSMYATLLHSFGSDKFVDMFYTYKMDPAYCANKRADFVYRIGVVDRVNILDWVNENYFANITDDMFTASQLEFLRNLPTFVPVAYRWANGIDGHETARKYDVDGKHPTVFDLSGDNITSPKDVEIVSVTGAQHGNIKYDEKTQKVTYTPPTTPTEYDRFDIIVKTEGGRRVTLNVNMRLVYKGLYGEVWVLDDYTGKRPTVSQAKEAVKGKTYNYTVSSPTAGVRFNNQNKEQNYNPVEYLHMQLMFRAPEAGKYTFYAQADDYAEIDLYNGSMKGNKAGTIEIKGDTTSYTRYNHVEMQLSKNDIVFFDCHLVNWGGLGHMTVGVHLPGAPEGEIVALPAENLLSASVKESELPTVDAFKGWQPRFVDSIKNATIDYQNSNVGWAILEEPASENGSDGKNMVDGNEGTFFHSKYNGQKAETPHVFVVDTQEEQTFNFFEIVRRTNGNDKLVDFELYACGDGEYETAGKGTETQGWDLLFKGSSSNVNAARQRISFSRTTLRYFKLIVTVNSGHTVIRELYAGVESKLSQTVKPSNYMTERQDFQENSANGKLSAETQGARFEFKFLGSSFELYADTDPSFGSASITVDGEEKGVIDLSDRPLFNKQVYGSGEMETKEHTVVVTTLDEKPFNISFINVGYGTPVAAGEYPADKTEQGEDDFGDVNVPRQFTREWKTFVKDYKTLTSIKFLKQAPDGYKDTYVRVDTYIRLYRKDSMIAFVYPGSILAPIECGSLFSGCEKLTELDLNNFDTTYMRGATSMFYGCKSLQTLDVSAFKTENVLGFGKMFGGCTSLQEVDLSVFKLDENANIYAMFENCVGLQTIELPDEIDGATLRARVRNARSAEEAVISCELPYVYRVEGTDTYLTELVISEKLAGSKLVLHNEHNFLSADCHKQQDPTCTEEGTVAYKECSVCRCDFDYENGTTLYRDLTIPKTGHHYVYGDPEGWNYPTCTTPGGICTHLCERCGFPCPDDGGEVAMPTIGHSYELDKSGDHANGYTIEFIKEEETIKTNMVDDDGNIYFVQEEIVVKSTAKVTYYLICEGIGDWSKWEMAQEAEVEGDHAKRDQLLDEARCHHLMEVVFEFECDTYTEATCTDAEAFFFDFSISSEDFKQAMMDQDEQDKVEDGITGFQPIAINHVYHGAEVEGGHEALGHVEETVDEVPATCTGYGSTKGKKCAVCDAVLEGITPIAPLDHDMKYRPKLEPTCTEAGHEAGLVCTRCGEEGEGVEHIAPLGHDFSIEIAEEAPTCTQVGHTAGHKCSRCDAIEGHDVLDDLGHLEEVMEGRAPTETESGLTDGLRCSRCGEILQEQTVIPPLGTTAGKPNNVWVWALVGSGAVLIAAGVAVTVILVVRKKRKN